MFRSAASVLVGRPVDGPPRWMSMISSGSSRLMARLMVSLLRATPGPLRGGHAEVAGEGGAQRGADGGDLVLGLERAHAEVLVLRQLVQDVGCRRDRVEPERDRQVGQLAGGDEAPGQRGVAGDVGVLARLAAWPAAIAYGWSNSSVVSPKARPARNAARLDVGHELVLGEALVDPVERRARPGGSTARRSGRGRRSSSSGRRHGASRRAATVASLVSARHRHLDRPCSR